MALLELQEVGRRYESAGGVVHALQDISLQIETGEMVAIMGASGSGKSTLMNLLGCLDVATAGHYRIDGVDAAALDADALAALRRERFGFIFQRYHLLAQQDALGNVEMPAIYAGLGRGARRGRARQLLERLGLGERTGHRPNALSGGQQQRVSIARALMNGGEIILADEPTGALDSRSGAEMMAVLHELHERGHTVILVTHDAQVAAHAPRVIELRDGRVLRDTGWPADAPRARFEPLAPASAAAGARAWRGVARRLAPVGDAMRMAFDSLRGHRLRSALSILGISIGIAAVVSIVTLGDAAHDSIQSNLSEMMSRRLRVWRGNYDMPPGAFARPLTATDIAALRGIPGVSGVLPQLERGEVLRHAARSGQVTVVGSEHGDIGRHQARIIEGRDLSDIDGAQRAQVLVLDRRARDRVFGTDGHALGETVLVGVLPFVVVGISGPGSGPFTWDGWERAFVPVSTFSTKLTADAEVNQLVVSVADDAAPAEVSQRVEHVLRLRHGTRDFNIDNEDENFRKGEQVIGVLQAVLSAIAGISLLVGGVGVMNIMLVAVSERTPEIGIRMAVGARPSDVQLQFLIEAVVLCAVGGLAGVSISWLAAAVVNLVQTALPVQVSWSALGAALGVSSAIGVAFGFFPARQASRLSPVAALARE